MLVEQPGKVTEVKSSKNDARLHLEPVLAPSRKKQPHPFIPHVKKTGLAKMLIKEALHYNTKLLFKKEYRAALLSRPCIYGVFDGHLGGFSPRKELCTGCYRCVQEFPGFCSVERNKAYTSFADSYWSGEDPERLSISPIATINYEAETGKIPIKGMGYKGSFAGAGWDSMWTDMSEIVRPTRDGVHGREYISTLVNLGRKPAYLKIRQGRIINPSKTLTIPLPIIFDHLPSNLNMQSVQESISETSEQIGTMFIKRISNPNRELKALRSSLIPLIKYEDFRQTETLDLEGFQAVELDFHPSWNYEEIKSSYDRLLIIVRVPFEKHEMNTARAIDLTRRGIDSLHLYANYHGKQFKSPNSLFIMDLLRRVHLDLIRERMRDEITVIASGGIILAEHVPKAIICGADLVAIDTSILVALQCEFKGECSTGETGRVQKENFPIEWGKQRLINLMASWHDQLIEILSAMGIRDVRRLRGDAGRAMFNEDLEKEAFADIARG
ncbi:MAG: glutamate synthase-related protein [Candidatus Heimdallarchaeota archaeon]